MALFQKSVVNKYLAELDNVLLEKQYVLFKNYFLNPVTQKNIIASKEEEFQEGFLRELFVKVFGYTINPEPDYNLKTEFKNVKDSKKADGAILDNNKVLAVIELKGTDTINLNQVEIQAFSYKNNQEGCRFVITSNFQKLRFYIDNAIDHLEWDLFRLDYEEFKLLYLCLSKESLFRNLPATIKEESLSQEESITKKLYKEYSNFRKALFNNITDKNPQFNKLLLFKKTQKLLDRFLFLFFAEDRNLLPPNSVRMILDQWTKLKEEYDEYYTLYERFKKYFGYLNTGYIGKTHEIFAYNGGLFATDEILDAIQIDDATLYEAALSLSRYDYNSDVDVNILGHIFEHSLTEIEELEAEIIQGEETDKSKTSKRKKDGVFYTPKYITKYIVENTLGTLCTNKKQELQIVEADYHSLQKKNTVKKLFEKLNQYREWLLHVTIVDPACGSGAFLNQALEFLIAEHKFISELEANITGSSIVFDVENSILENNLFGVDINEESVEIAKLSLWLRTARKGRKLNSLNNNIKCGNSLIDDVTVAGDKAFNWQKEFPQIFGEYIEVVLSDKQKKSIAEEITEEHPASEPRANTNYDEVETATYNTEQVTNDDNAVVNTDFKIVNEPVAVYNIKKQVKKGFDMVIGNPPYVRPHNIADNEKVFLWNKYYVASQKTDLYAFFTEKGATLLKDNGFLGYIMPKTWMSIHSFLKLRQLLIEKYNINQIGILPAKVFDDAIVETAIIVFENNRNDTDINFINVIENQVIKSEKHSSILKSNHFNLNENVQKENVNTVSIGDICEIIVGIATGDDKKYCRFEKLTELDKKAIRGANISRYNINYIGEYLWYDREQMILDGNNKPKSSLKQAVGQSSPKKSTDFEIPEKIVMQRISKKIIASLDTEQFYAHTSVVIIKPNKAQLFKTKYLLAVLNSAYINYWLMTNSSNVSINVGTVKNIPIKIIGIEKQSQFEIKVDFLLIKNRALQLVSQQFTQLLTSKFPSLNINTKLDKWYTLSFADFNKELSKQKIKLTLQDQSEWLDFFEKEKQNAAAIKIEIDIADRQIDKMVYELYQLTDEEIKIVEGS